MTLPHSPETPLPTPHDYERAARCVDGSIDETVGGVERFLYNKSHFYNFGMPSEKRLLRRVDQYGQRIEPQDHASNRLIDETQSSRRILGYGAVAGLVVVEKLHGRILFTRDILDNTPFAGRSLSSVDIKNLILTHGDEGLEIMGDRTVALIEKWQELLTQDIEKGLLFKHMIGLIALGAHNAHHAYNVAEADRYEMQRFAEEIDRIGSGSPEFDEELNRMLGR